jgi:hypothetical protein
MNMQSEARRYSLGPFLIESPFTIPELSEAESSGTPDVRLVAGTVPRQLTGVVAGESRWTASRDEYLLHADGVASFWVRNGREVVIELAPNALMMDVRAYLLAPIFSTLCLQTGRFALHASAFIGNSGAGKSTFAACLLRRGYKIVSDDICLIETAASGATQVVPVAPSIKLWKSTMEELGGFSAELPRVFSKNDKYRIPTTTYRERLPLKNLLFLQWAPESSFESKLKPLDNVTALSKMMEFTHQAHLVKAMNRRRENFELCAKVLKNARAREFTRPRDIQQINNVVDMVEDFLMSD